VSFVDTRAARFDAVGAAIRPVEVARRVCRISIDAASDRPELEARRGADGVVLGAAVARSGGRRVFGWARSV